ncbi:MAG: cupin domain-containing protein [Pirellulaceae bacterium]
MTDKHVSKWTRRSMLAGSAAAVVGAMGSTVKATVPPANADVKTYTNADFYSADGTFQEDKAREAYFDMFRRFGYPISDRLKEGQEGMWILDFGLSDFARVGMAGIFWLNRQDYNYFGHEIYLLPGQMIPEHKHLATDKGGAKMESWQPRHGMIYTFGEGEATLEMLDVIPPSQRELVKSRHCRPLGIDEVGDLNRLTAWHFMVAGPEGALVTEYGTFHDMDGLRFSNPKATL